MTGKPWEKYQTVNTADFPPVNLSAPVMPSSVDMSAPLSPMQWQEKIAPLDAPGKPWEKYQTAEPVQEVKPETGDGFAKGPGAAFAYGLNSAVPFGNVITSGLAAGALAPFTDLTFRELYDQAQADTKATREQNTGASIAGTVAGIGATLPLASAKAISGVSSFWAMLASGCYGATSTSGPTPHPTRRYLPPSLRRASTVMQYST
jgi:hypothetical protein